MPPRNDDSHATITGWKVAMGLLMLIQTVGLGVAWKTFDAISELRKETTISTYQLNHEIKPMLMHHEEEIERLKQGQR